MTQQVTLVQLKAEIALIDGPDVRYTAALIGELRTWCPVGNGGRGRQLDPYEMTVMACIIAGERRACGVPIRIDIAASAIVATQELL